MPKTVPFNDKDGKQIGTATFSRNRIYIRDLNGEWLAQIVFEADGKMTLYDSSGKVLDQLVAPGK